jgi:hypothetical protein
LRAKNTFAPFHVVEVNLQNTLLAQKSFQRKRDDQFLPFAQKISFSTEKQIFCQLLGDGGAANHFRRFAFGRCTCLRFFIALPSFLDGLPLHTVMAGKHIVFRCNDRTAQRGVDSVLRHPLLTPTKAMLRLQHLHDL